MKNYLRNWKVVVKGWLMKIRLAACCISNVMVVLCLLRTGHLETLANSTSWERDDCRSLGSSCNQFK